MPSKEIPGLKARLDNVIYQFDPVNLQEDKPHAFIYFITISNLSDRKVTLLGRKWIIENCDHSTHVIEGDKIVGKTPTLAPGENFSYNSYHVSDQNAHALGSFHGIDEFKENIHVKLEPFHMKIPKNNYETD